MNKKGLAPKFMAGFVFIILIVIFGIILGLIVSSYQKDKEREFQVHRAFLETSHHTRTTLMQQYEGKYLYELILEEFNQNGALSATTRTHKILTENNPGVQWYVYINQERLPSSRSLQRLDTIIPDFIIPNIDGAQVRVKIKVLHEGDFELRPTW